MHAKCLVWYLTPRQYVVNLASPFFRHLLSRIRQKCHNQRCWWQEAWAKQAEELLGCICQLWCALKKLKLGALGHELFPQLGKEAGPRKEQTSFQSIIGKCKKKKKFLKTILKCILLMPQSRSMQFLFPNSCKCQFLFLICLSGGILWAYFLAPCTVFNQGFFHIQYSAILSAIFHRAPSRALGKVPKSWWSILMACCDVESFPKQSVEGKWLPPALYGK